MTLLLCSLSVLPLTACAQDSPPAQGWAQHAVGETIADRPSDLYRFETHKLESEDGKRRYKIELSIPRVGAPDAGYPVLYMLDGNAAMDTLTAQDLASISQGNPPVLVAVGYDVAVRNDVASRAFDYTPPVYENGKRLDAPTVRGRVGGGADTFLTLFTDKIKPVVHQRAPIDTSKEYLWGHSYGGLFVLYALFTQPDAFARYIMGDPSVWWHEGAIMHDWRAFVPSRAAGKRVAVMVGTKLRDPARPAPDPTADANAQHLRDMVAGLGQAGASVSHDTFPQYGHGDMIRVSLERALEIAATP